MDNWRANLQREGVRDREEREFFAELEKRRAAIERGEPDALTWFSSHCPREFI
jgi:hypothetical protein